MRESSPARRSGGALLVWALLIVAANLRAPLTGVGPILDQAQADLGLTAAQAGLLTTVPLLAFAGLSPLVPRLTQRWAPERVLGAALVILAVGIALRWVPDAFSLFAGTLLVGSGIALGNVLLPAIIKRDFPHSVGMLTGAYTSVMGGIAAVASGVAVPLSHVAPGGWRAAIGGWVLLVAVAIVLWLPQARAARDHRGRAGRGGLPWHSGLAWVVSAFMGVQSMAFYVAITWLPQILQDSSGMTPTTAGWLLFVFQAVPIFTNLAVPFFMRREGDQRVTAVVISGMVVAGYLGLLVAPALSPVWVVLLGAACGASLVLALTFLSLRAHDAEAAGGLSAMAQSIGYLVAAVGPVAFGILHTVAGGWFVPLLVMCVIAVGQTALATVAGRGLIAGRDD